MFTWKSMLLSLIISSVSGFFFADTTPGLFLQAKFLEFVANWMGLPIPNLPY